MGSTQLTLNSSIVIFIRKMPNVVFVTLASLVVTKFVNMLTLPICVTSRKRHGPRTTMYEIHKIAGCACTGNAGNVSPATDVKDPGMHHGTCVTPSRGIANPPWRGKHSRHSRRKRNPQFYVSGKRPMGNRTDRRAHQAQAVVAAAVAAVVAVVVVVVSLLLLLLLFTVSALSSFVKIFQVYLYHSVLLNLHCVNHMIIPVTE